MKTEWLDEYIEDLMVDRFAEPDVIAASTAGDDSESIRARAEADQLAARLTDLWGQVKRGRLSSDEYVDAKSEIQPQIEAAEQRAREAGTPPQLRWLTSLVEGGDVAEVRRVIRLAWREMPLSAQRDAVRLAFDHIRISRAKVRPLAERISGIDTDRVSYDWRRKWA